MGGWFVGGKVDVNREGGGGLSKLTQVDRRGEGVKKSPKTG